MSERITFIVKPAREWPSSDPNTFTLVRDNWDDYSFKTMYVLHYADSSGERHEIGAVKIGEFGLGDSGGRPTLSSRFQTLDTHQFSVGQDREYYERLLSLEDGLGQRVLAALNDIALDIEIFARAKEEPVTQISLFRSVAERTVEEQFRRITLGGVALTRYDFNYSYPEQPGTKTPKLQFLVEPNSKPPSNVHVLIGSNGAGKTSLLRNMENALLEPDRNHGRFLDSALNGERVPFVNLVTVTFSAFDPFEPKEGGDVESPMLQNAYVGLKKPGENSEEVKTTAELAVDFLKSLKECASGARRQRWKDSIEILYSDPLLADSEIIRLLDNGRRLPADEEILSSFTSLSSGHKIVLLTITRLVETVAEKSLVLMDEPEAHLHPPLLSAFTRAISNLLEDRNGVAIVATHSPVILQEVPRDCVYRISRVGSVINAERLSIETFGEDVGSLTSAVFGLEVTQTGFHKMLLEAISETDGSYSSALNLFDGQLGGEGRAILRSRSQGKDGR